MGGCVSIAVSCDKAVENLTSCLSGDQNPCRKIVDHVAKLKKTLAQLEARRDDLLNRIEVEEYRSRYLLVEVQQWLSEVEITVREGNELILRKDDEIDKLCCCQYCTTSWKSYDYSKKVVNSINEVESLLPRGVFGEVFQKDIVPKVKERFFHQKIFGQEEIVDSTWNSLMEDGVGILGIYGMPGVGKTTLLSQINNKFLTVSNDFNIVIWVVVSRNPTVKRIQEVIGKRLEIYHDGWERETESEIASIIAKSLEKKKYVLLLDDMWAKVDLASIGIPDLERNGSKIAFTTRLNDVCGSMGAAKEIEVTCLKEADAWSLFTRNMEETLESHPDIPKVAESVAQRCSGLPLALSAVGETMARKRSIEEWRHALDVLSVSAAMFLRLEEDVLSVLKFSYDALECEETKLCFLFCALFPEDYEIGKDDLIEYWVGQGIILGSKGKNLVGYDIIGTLVRACLLQESETTEKVKMHDVVREMALWISSGCGAKQQENVVIVKANSQLREIPKIEDGNVVRKMSLIGNQIVKACNSLHCPKLETLLLRDNRLTSISSGFLSHVPLLVVLDLSLNPNLIKLPDISKLTSLRYLNLSCTGITSLPYGLYILKKLIYLNLEHTYMLKSIKIDSSWRLKVLRLYASGIVTSDKLVTQIQKMPCLDLLTITLRNSNLDSFLRDERFHSYNEGLALNMHSSPIRLPIATISSCHFLEIQDSHIPKIDIERSIGTSAVMLGYRIFTNLRKVRLDNCTGLRDLTWLIFAPHLADLYLVMLPDIQEIISIYEQSIVEETMRSVGSAFGELEFLTLMSLDNLKSIYWKPLPLRKLKQINIKRCPKLTELPLESRSALQQNVVINAEEEWLRGVQWWDTETKQRFFPS